MEQEILLDKKMLKDLRRIIYELTGNYYPDDRLLLLTKKLNIFLGQTQNNAINIEDFLKYKKLTMELLDIITVPETKFFREKPQLDVFIKHIVPNIKQKPIKIASFGCATGEEPYTLAMMLESQNIPYQIIGFDINLRYLEKAEQGIYLQRKLNDIPQKYHYFVSVDENTIKIKDIIKKNVQFKQLNFIKQVDFYLYHHMFDVAFCRNALIYFDHNSKLKSIKNINSTLKMDGYFIVSMTEILMHTQFFETFKIENMFFYKKIKENEQI